MPYNYLKWHQKRNVKKGHRNCLVTPIPQSLLRSLKKRFIKFERNLKHFLSSSLLSPSENIMQGSATAPARSPSPPSVTDAERHLYEETIKSLRESAELKERKAARELKNAVTRLEKERGEKEKLKLAVEHRDKKLLDIKEKVVAVASVKKPGRPKKERSAYNVSLDESLKVSVDCLLAAGVIKKGDVSDLVNEYLHAQLDPRCVALALAVNESEKDGDN